MVVGRGGGRQRSELRELEKEQASDRASASPMTCFSGSGPHPGPRGPVSHSGRQGGLLSDPPTRAPVRSISGWGLDCPDHLTVVKACRAVHLTSPAGARSSFLDAVLPSLRRNPNRVRVSDGTRTAAGEDSSPALLFRVSRGFLARRAPFPPFSRRPREVIFPWTTKGGNFSLGGGERKSGGGKSPHFRGRHSATAAHETERKREREGERGRADRRHCE